VNCYICKTATKPVISLSNQKNTSLFPKYGEHEKEITYPILLSLCENCGLVQLNNTATPDSMYKTGQYGYKSSISNTMRHHLKSYNDDMLTKKKITTESVVLDIGCNDGTFLKYYDMDCVKIGIDPTGAQFKEYYEDSNITLISDYFTKDIFLNKCGNIKCDIITSICMFYDLPDPVEFARDIYSVLDDDGIWSCEQSYLLTMLKTNSLDTICHEHLEYYCLTPIKKIADMVGFKIIDIKFNSSNGGSFRIYFCKKMCKLYDECHFISTTNSSSI
jgi:SAM-dependent methyltransferase